MLDEPTAPPSTGARWKKWLRTALPWVLAVVLVVWITGRVSWAEAWEAANQAELGAFAGVLSLAGLYWFLLDSFGYSFLFSRFNAPVSWAEARSVRALTYLLTPINWNVGTAGVILHLRQSKGVDAVESTSSMMLYGAVDGVVIVGLLALGIAIVPDAGAVGAALPWVLLFIGGQTAFFALVMADKPSWGWLERLRGARILQSYRSAAARDLITLFALRSTYMGGFVGLFWWGSGAFGVNLPLGTTAVTLPLVLGSAMFTPAGLGSQQAVMLELWQAYGPAAAILAFGVAFPVGLILVRLAIGLFYLGDLREFRRARKLAQAAELESAPPRDMLVVHAGSTDGE